MKIVISVGGRFHAFHLAEQLEQRGHLTRLLTTELLTPRDRLPRYKIKTFRWPEYIGYAWRKSHLDPFIRWNVVKDNLFDGWATRQIEPCDLFVGFAHYSLGAFRKLAPRGIKTIVESGSSHIEYVSQLLCEEYSRYAVPFQPISPSEKDKQCREYAEANYIAVPSEYARRSFLEMGIAPEKLIAVTLGVDISLFSPVPKQDDVFRVLFVGRASLTKGLQYLLPAWKKLGLAGKAELCLIGPLADEIRPFFKEYAGIFRHFGSMTQPELVHFYSQASVFVLPSINDGFGMVIAEAMACGLPVICSENTGGPDLVRDGQDGFIVPIRNVDALAEKIQYLYDNPEIRSEMGRQARQQIQKFTWDAYGEKIVAAYARLMG